MSSFIFSYFSFSLAIVLNSSWLISKSKNASDNKISRLCNLLLARITILLCLFVLFLVIFNGFYIIYFVKENTRVKLAIPTETAVTHAKEIIDIPPLVAGKTMKVLSIYSKAALSKCIVFY